MNKLTKNKLFFAVEDIAKLITNNKINKYA